MCKTPASIRGLVTVVLDMNAPQAIIIRCVTEFSTVSATASLHPVIPSSAVLLVPGTTANLQRFNLAMFYTQRQYRAGACW